MGCPCRNKRKEAVTSVNTDPYAAQRAYDANNNPQASQPQEQPEPAAATR